MIKHSANDMVSEQVDRLVAKCAREKNIVSEAALYELKLAVEASPEDFIADEEERLFLNTSTSLASIRLELLKKLIPMRTSFQAVWICSTSCIIR